MTEFCRYAGLDVHRDTTAVVLPGRGEPVCRGGAHARAQAQWLRHRTATQPAGRG